MKLIKKLNKNLPLNLEILRPFRLTDKEMDNLYTLFPEGLSVENNIFVEDSSLLMTIQKGRRNIFLDDNLIINSYKEEGHEIILCYLDIPCYYGSKESLEYFIKKYIKIEEL